MKNKFKNILFILTILFSGFTFQSWTTITDDVIHEETTNVIDLESNLSSNTSQDCYFAYFTITYSTFLTYNEKKTIRRNNNVSSYTVIGPNTEIWAIWTCPTGGTGDAVTPTDPDIILLSDDGGN